MVWEQSRLTVDLQRNAGAPCAHHNPRDKFLSIPDEDSTKSPSHMSTHIVEEIDVHANGDEKRRDREGQESKYLPANSQSNVALPRMRWLTS